MEKTTFNHLSADLWSNEKLDLSMITTHSGPTIFQQNIRYSFKNSSLLLEAICHSSFAHEFGLKSNETLEFLGDSVLDLLVSSKLLELFENLNEGELSKLRGALVNEEVLSQLALAVGLDRVLLLGKGESNEAGFSKPALLADLLEAMLGALYLDGGLAVAKSFFEGAIGLYEREFNQKYYVLERLDFFDSKSRLQELTMALFKELPRYQALEREDGLFEVSLFIGERYIDKVVGPSKKKATKQLASKVLKEKSYVT